jgi:cysteate synthase
VLTQSRGDMLAVGNDAVRRAMAMFEEAEGIDIDAAAGVALASLLAAAQSGRVEREAVVLLNLTGGGWCRRRRDRHLIPVHPAVLIDEHESHTPEALEQVLALF